MAIIDSYSESNQNTAFSTSYFTGFRYGVGQSFTGDGTDLSWCQFYLQRNGALSGNCRAQLYAHTGTFGASSKPTGSPLATSNDVDASTLNSSMSLVTFTFPTPYTVVNGTYYVIAFETSVVDSNHTILIGIDSTSPTHAGNTSDISYGGSWASHSSDDTIFYALSGTPPSGSQSNMLLLGMS